MEDAAGELPADAILLVIVSQFNVVGAQTGTEFALWWSKPPALCVVIGRGWIGTNDMVPIATGSQSMVRDGATWWTCTN